MGPFKCPDCGVWWAGLEHRCRPAGSATGTWSDPRPPIETNTFTVLCTCPPERGDNYHGSCPIHDVDVTATGAFS